MSMCIPEATNDQAGSFVTLRIDAITIQAARCSQLPVSSFADCKASKTESCAPVHVQPALVGKITSSANRFFGSC